MAGNIQIPQNLTDLVDIELVVKQKPEVLTQFLIELTNEIKDLQARVQALENGN
jgi:hypothetical protein